MKRSLHKIVIPTVLFLTSMSGNLQGGNKPPPVKAEPPCTGHFLLEGDLLCWKARQVGLELFSNTARFNGETAIDSDTEQLEIFNTKRRYHRPNFDWKLGFRVGAGYDFKGCNWAVLTYWTHLNGHGHADAHMGEAHAKGHWNMSYDVLDAIVTGPQFSLGSSFTWKAFGGARAAKIVQKQHSRSESSGISVDPFSTQNITLDTATADESIRTIFYGIGPELGLKTGWNLKKGFSIYANGGGSLLYNHYNEKFSTNFVSTNTFLSTTDPTETSTFVSKDKSYASANTCQFVLDLAFGLCWQQYACICNHSMAWVVKLGWEHSQWFDHNARGLAGDLCLDGVTLSTQVEF